MAETIGNGESEMNAENSKKLTDGIGARILSVTNNLGSKKGMSDITGISLSQLDRYITEESQPTIEPLAKIAQAAKVSLEWLATGRNPSMDNNSESCSPMGAENIYARTRLYFKEDAVFPASALPLIERYEFVAEKAALSARLAVIEESEEMSRKAMCYEIMAATMEMCLGIIIDPSSAYSVDFPGV